MQTYTFWQLVNQYKIEIPIVQRDYAQGRADSKSMEVREKFLDDLLSCLINNGSPLELDFVYGKVVDKTFIPIDGQQRLTTLFLLHWYVGIRDKRNEEIKKIKFSYKTRFSARDFCENLIDSHFELGVFSQAFLDYAKANKINDSDRHNHYVSFTIKNASWFFLSWQKDPTVQAMLNMLDAIHSKFKDEDLMSVWQNLTKPNYLLPQNNPKLNLLVSAIESDINKSVEVIRALKEAKTPNPISFKFLNLLDFKLSDELYLKMNARGAPLGDFESFKAWLIGYIDKSAFRINDTKWEINLDKDWTDLFWKFNNDNKIDDQAMRFFIEMGLTCFISNNEKNKELSQTIQNLAFTKDRNVDYYSNKYLESLNIFHEDSLNLIFRTLNALYHSICQGTFKGVEKTSGSIDIFKSYIDVHTLFRKIITNENLTYSNRVTFYSYILFISSKNDINEEALYNWMRVIRNIVENTTIDSPVTFANAINAINIFHGFKFEILENLAEGKCDSIPFFGTQLQEEKIKALLIRKGGANWRSEIIDAENHPFFRGNIGFLLPSKEASEFEQFIQRKNVAMKLFDANGAVFGKDVFLTIRTILCFTKQEIILPITIQNNRESWLRLLSNKATQDGFISMIDKYQDEFGDCFEGECRDFTDTSVKWKYYLVKNPNPINEVNEKKIQSYGVNENGEPNIFLFNAGNWSERVILISNNRNELVSGLIHSCDFEFKGYDSYNIDDTYFRGGTVEIEKKIKSLDNVLCLKFNLSYLTITLNGVEESPIDYIDIDIDFLIKKLMDKYPLFFSSNIYSNV